jgi:hypothetical protein
VRCKVLTKIFPQIKNLFDENGSAFFLLTKKKVIINRKGGPESRNGMILIALGAGW